MFLRNYTRLLRSAVRLSRPVDPGFYPGSSTFVNRLGITNNKELLLAEAEYTSFQADQYAVHPSVGAFDLFHLQVIHSRLFRDVYRWAGRCRAYDMKKGDSIFCPAKDLRKYASQLFGALEQEDWLSGLREDRFVQRLAYYYSLTNKLHPFPEGNGRAQRLFFAHLAAANSYRIQWQAAHAWEIEETAVQSFAGRLEPTIYMFERLVVPLGDELRDPWFNSSDTRCVGDNGSHPF